MSIPDIRRRSGYLFLALAVGHIILISAQVTSPSGVPLLQAFVFGVFSEVPPLGSGGPDSAASQPGGRVGALGGAAPTKPDPPVKRRP
jgi:hypothetical protein